MKNRTENPNTASPVTSDPGVKRVFNHRDSFPDSYMTPERAYEIIRKENSTSLRCKLDMGTFITTHADKYANKIAAEYANMNLACMNADNTSRKLARRCINMLADLWNAPRQNDGQACGLATTGSSEGCMLSALAALQRWKKRLPQSEGSVRKPNLVVSAARHPAWDRFCRFWDVELRVVELTESAKTLDPAAAIGASDENTIMVVAIAGDTYSGLSDDVAALDAAVTIFNKKRRTHIPIHVDAAIGGFVLPFVYPEKVWDFRLVNVVSINTSAHKFGLVYPGLGWLIWRGPEFSTDPSKITPEGFANTRPAAQVIMQYYQFLRLGFAGYEAVMNSCMSVAGYVCAKIAQMDAFTCLSETIESPFLSFRMDPEYARTAKWDLTDLKDYLQKNGWSIHLLQLPYVTENRSMLRLVFRRSMEMDLAELLIKDILSAVEHLEQNNHTGKKSK